MDDAPPLEVRLQLLEAIIERAHRSSPFGPSPTRASSCSPVRAASSRRARRRWRSSPSRNRRLSVKTATARAHGPRRHRRHATPWEPEFQRLQAELTEEVAALTATALSAMGSEALRTIGCVVAPCVPTCPPRPQPPATKGPPAALPVGPGWSRRDAALRVLRSPSDSPFSFCPHPLVRQRER
jgi:hypothetical protein